MPRMIKTPILNVILYYPDVRVAANARRTVMPRMIRDHVH